MNTVGIETKLYSLIGDTLRYLCLRYPELMVQYEGESISDQPIPFPMDREGQGPVVQN